MGMGPEATGRFTIHEGLLYCADATDAPQWKVCEPDASAAKLFDYVHVFYGHAGSDRCIRLINGAFHVKNVGRRTPKLLSRYETRQKVNHPNWKYEDESRPHLPNRVGQLASTSTAMCPKEEVESNTSLCVSTISPGL
jgi:hypothetical protein